MKKEGRIRKDEWETVTLGDIASIERNAIQPEAIIQGTNYLGLEHIESGGNILGAKPVDEGELASSKFKFTERHVLYGKLRPYLAKIACPHFTGICSTDILPILPGPRLERLYLCYFLRQPSMVDYANSRAEGVNLPRLSPSALAKFEIPLPPLAEQRRIAEVLDRAESLRAKRRSTLTQLDSITQSIFLDLFGDPKAKGWTMTNIASVVNEADGGIRTGPFGSQLLHSEFTEQGIAVLGIDNAVANEFRWGERRFISETKYRQLKRYTVRPGDVLITIMGTCGRCAVVPDDIPPAINTKHLCCLTLDIKKCLPSFLHTYFLRHPIALQYLHQAAKGAIMSGLNMGLIKGMPVPLPPITLQREFTQRIKAVEALKKAHRASLAELDALFAALQHRAFRGEL